MDVLKRLPAKCVAGQMINLLRLNFADNRGDLFPVTKITSPKGRFPLKMRARRRKARITAGAKKFNSIPGKQRLGQMRPRETSYACHKNAHKRSLRKVDSQ